MFRGLHNWLIKSWVVFVNSEYCKQQLSRFYLMFCPQLFIFLERSCDCFSVRQSIINKAAWNQCYISLDNGRDDAASSQHTTHRPIMGNDQEGRGSQQQVAPLGPSASSTWCCHASLNFLIYKMTREKNCRHHQEYLKTALWWWWWWWRCW